jgi:hypothetical protein
MKSEHTLVPERLGAALLDHLRNDTGVIAHNCHAESNGALGEGAPNVPHTDNSQHFARKLDPFHLFFIPATGLHRCVGSRDGAGQRQHQGQGMLGNCHSGRLGSVDHHHALVGGSLQIDVVDTNPGPPDHPQRGRSRQHLPGHPAATAHNERMAASQCLD